MNIRRRLAGLILGRPYFLLDGAGESESWLITRTGAAVMGMSIKEWDAEFTDTIEPRRFDLSNTTYRPGRIRTFRGTFS